MACLNFSISPVDSASLSLSMTEDPSVSIDTTPSSSVQVDIAPQAIEMIMPAPQASVFIQSSQMAALSIGEVCSVSEGEIFVLASTDGPLRTKNGGYILLRPPLNLLPA